VDIEKAHSQSEKSVITKKGRNMEKAATFVTAIDK